MDKTMWNTRAKNMRNRKPFFLAVDSRTWKGQNVISLNRGIKLVSDSKLYDHLVYFDGRNETVVFSKTA